MIKLLREDDEIVLSRVKGVEGRAADQVPFLQHIFNSWGKSQCLDLTSVIMLLRFSTPNLGTQPSKPSTSSFDIHAGLA